MYTQPPRISLLEYCQVSVCVFVSPESLARLHLLSSGFGSMCPAGYCDTS